MLKKKIHKLYIRMGTTSCPYAPLSNGKQRFFFGRHVVYC